jgi:two-component system sensor histidine kinase KdpD
MFPHFAPANLIMVYLLGVAFVATRLGGGPAVLASLLSVAAFDFFFIPPYLTFAVHDTQYVITFLVMLLIAILISGLTDRVRAQAENARSKYLRTIALYFMSRQLAGAADREQVLATAARHISDVFDGDAVLFAPRAEGDLAVAAGERREFALLPNEAAAAQWVFDHLKWAGWSTDTLPSAQAIYMPLTSTGRALGVLGLRPNRRDPPLDPEQRHLLDTFATQTAIALERAMLAEQAQRAKVEVETERLRVSLLSSVSHDLRTPLASIAGSASVLLADKGHIDAATRQELLRSICDEGERLGRLVENLLQMTKLEARSVTPNSQWYPLEELVGSALGRLATALHAHRVEVHLPKDSLLVFADGMLIEQVLTNLLENCAKHTPPGATVTVSARAEADAVEVEVADDGPGLPPGDEEAVFRKFYRGRPSADRTGFGLGLAICRAIVQLHDGRIWAENRPHGGVRFRFRLPLPAGPVAMPNELAAVPDAMDKDGQLHQQAGEAR